MEVWPVCTTAGQVHTLRLTGDGPTQLANFVLCQIGKALCCERFTQTWR